MADAYTRAIGSKITLRDLLDSAASYDKDYDYGTVLPFRVNKRTKEKELAAPTLLKDIARAITAPERAMRGEIDPLSPEGLQEAMNLAGNAVGPSVAYSATSPTTLATLSANGARMSKADAVAQGYYHPIGEGKKLRTLIPEMSATRIPIKDLPEHNIITPEKLVGSKLVPALGDRTAAGSLLTEINGSKLRNPVMLEGGPDFMRTHLNDNVAWASNKGAITKIANQIRRAGESGQDVYMPYVAMGHTSGDFSTMMSDALLEQALNGGITLKALKMFDKNVKALRPEFVGITHPGVREQLNRNGALRHAFVDTMKLDPYVDAGFPDLPSTRYAITEPKLLDAPYHSSGFSIAKMDPTGKVISNPANPHTSYDTQLVGQFVGGLDRNVPRDIMFPDFYRARRMMGADPAGDRRAFDLSTPIQNANQEWLDGVMKYMESVR